MMCMSCRTWSKQMKLPVPQFTHLWNGADKPNI